jgi:hypothetical protein
MEETLPLETATTPCSAVVRDPVGGHAGTPAQASAPTRFVPKVPGTCAWQLSASDHTRYLPRLESDIPLGQTARLPQRNP